MNATRRRHISSFVILSIVAACTAASPSADPSPAPATTTATPTVAAPTKAPNPTSSATTDGPLGGGLMVVWQLDGTSPDTAKTETVYTLDVGTGAKTVLGSLPVNDQNCCPSEVRLSPDRSRAFLTSNQYRANVDLRAGTVQPLATQAPGWARISNRGDRLAWVDDVTGLSETIVVSDLQGTELARLALHGNGRFSAIAWSPDDSAFAVTTQIPLGRGAAPGIKLASAIACCTVDRGLEATHLLIVPLDGSPLRDIFDDGVEVAQDQLVPIPSKPPTVEGDTPRVQRSLGPAGWSPDGRSLLMPGSVCPPTWNPRRNPVTCTYSLYRFDIETGMSTTVLEEKGPIQSVAWSPDSRRIAVISGPFGSSGLVVMDADGRNLARLSDAEGGTLSWSPDGTWIAFWRLNPTVPEGQNRIEVWAMPSDGGGARLIAPHAAAGWSGSMLGPQM